MRRAVVQLVPGILCLVRADEREQVVVLKEFTSRGVAAGNTGVFAYVFEFWIQIQI